MPLSVVNWIMACVSSTQIVVLVNGAASAFFKSGKEISQGCPLSPLLFLLTIEGLSKLILDAKTKGFVKGIKVCKDLSTTHSLFANDVLLFGMGSLDE